MANQDAFKSYRPLNLFQQPLCNYLADPRDTAPETPVNYQVYSNTNASLRGMHQWFNGVWNQYVHNNWSGDIAGTLNFTTNFTIQDATQIDELNCQYLQGWEPKLASNSNTIILRDGDGRAQINTPTANNHIANKQYVDLRSEGAGRAKEPVRVATERDMDFIRSGNTIRLPSNGNINNVGIDGVTNLVSGDHILVLHENLVGNVDSTTGTSSVVNGIYAITSLGSSNTQFTATRRTDANENTELLHGLQVVVKEGNVNERTTWLLNTDGNITVNITPLQFILASVQTDFDTGNGLEEMGTTLSVKIDSTQFKFSNTGQLQLFSTLAPPAEHSHNASDIQAGEFSVADSETRFTFPNQVAAKGPIQIVSPDVVYNNTDKEFGGNIRNFISESGGNYSASYVLHEYNWHYALQAGRLFPGSADKFAHVINGRNGNMAFNSVDVAGADDGDIEAATSDANYTFVGVGVTSDDREPIAKFEWDSEDNSNDSKHVLVVFETQDGSGVSQNSTLELDPDDPSFKISLNGNLLADFQEGTTELEPILNLRSQTNSNGVVEGSLVKVGDELRIGTGDDQSASIPKKYAANIGNGQDTSINVNHNLNTRDFTYIVRESAGDQERVGVTMDIVDDNNITISFGNFTPPANSHRVVVIG